MKTSVALIGFMGTGKSAAGRLLAQMTGREFVELDDIIEQRAGKTIPEIFRQEEEIGFREREIAAVKEVSSKKNAVIACGGGVVLNTINIDRLRQECTIVCLSASPNVILERTRQQVDNRPLLAGGHELERIVELMKFRQPFYRLAADVTVNTSRLNPERVAGRIRDMLQL